MSSTNRGGKRSDADFYATPPWVTHRLMDLAVDHPELALPGGRWLEPCAGDGEIIRTIQARRSDIEWTGCELRKSEGTTLSQLCAGGVRIGDFLEVPTPEIKFDVAITNPPFSIAYEVLTKCMTLAHRTVLLLRLNFLGTEDRYEFMRQFPPLQVNVVPNRPVFSLNKHGKPGTDSIEYAWFVWGSYDFYQENVVTFASLRMLRLTSLEDRKSWSQHLLELARKAGGDLEQLLTI